MCFAMAEVVGGVFTAAICHVVVHRWMMAEVLYPAILRAEAASAMASAGQKHELEDSSDQPRKGLRKGTSIVKTLTENCVEVCACVDRVVSFHRAPTGPGPAAVSSVWGDREAGDARQPLPAGVPAAEEPTQVCVHSTPTSGSEVDACAALPCRKHHHSRRDSHTLLAVNSNSTAALAPPSSRPQGPTGPVEGDHGGTSVMQRARAVSHREL